VPEVLVPLAESKFDDEGNLIDAETRCEIRDLVVALAAWTRRLAESQPGSIAS
jgi:hypothetical protein